MLSKLLVSYIPLIYQLNYHEIVGRFDLKWLKPLAKPSFSLRSYLYCASKQLKVWLDIGCCGLNRNVYKFVHGKCNHGKRNFVFYHWGYFAKLSHCFLASRIIYKMQTLPKTLQYSSSNRWTLTTLRNVMINSDGSIERNIRQVHFKVSRNAHFRKAF